MDTGRPKVPPPMHMFDYLLRHIQSEGGLPNLPGQDPGVSVTFSMDVQIIGWALCGSIHFPSSQIISQQESVCGHHL